MTFTKTLALIAGFALTALPAAAASYKFEFEGEIVSTNDGSTSSVASIGSITTGDAVSGSFVLDNDLFVGGAADTFAVNSVTDFNMVVDGLSYTGPGSSTATLRNDHMSGSSAPLRDNFFVANYGPLGPMVAGLSAARIQFSVGGTDTSILSDTNAPTVQQYLDMWAADTIGGSLNFLSFSDGSDARFEVSSLTISAVPLPAGGLLLLGGLGALGLMRRRKP